MRTVFRAVGWTLTGIAAVLLARDLFDLLSEGRFEPLSLGFVWNTLNSSSLQLAEAGVSRYLHPWLWHPVIVTLLLWPAFAVIGTPGVLLLLTTRPRRRRGSVFRSD
ncbi:MAG: hypothetical protein HQ481_15745 [Alphaproteobacteria bacterium]|nr:hypothetical protein [Alphaproteobacteria bacterium]